MAKANNKEGKTERETKVHDISEVDREQIKKIAAKAKLLREEKGYTYESFALHAGINRNSYFRLEQAAKSGNNYTVALLLKVIRGLGSTPAQFFGDI